MAKIISHRLFSDIFVSVAVLLSILALMLFPTQSVEAAKSGLELCGNVIIPSLFPFFVLSGLLVEMGLVKHLGKLLQPVMGPLFNVDGSCAAAFALGFIGGYPVGAVTAINLYKKGWCSKSEAERLLAFCNNSGPAFILGVVGAGIFSSSLIGIVLYLAHILSSVLVGTLFRSHGANKEIAKSVSSQAEAPSSPGFTTAFTVCVKNAATSTINICAFVIFFTVVIKMLFLTGVMDAASSVVAVVLSPLGFNTQWAEKLLIGAIEMSSGVWSLSGAAGTLTGKLSMAAFILGWAGVSVHCQVLSFIGGSGLSARTYVAGKALHGIISAGLVYIISKLFPLGQPVSHYLAEQVTGIAEMDFSTALTASTVTAFTVWAIVIVISAFMIGKGYGNSRKNRV